jgi:hypothetical protein
MSILAAFEPESHESVRHMGPQVQIHPFRDVGVSDADHDARCSLLRKRIGQRGEESIPKGILPTSAVIGPKEIGELFHPSSVFDRSPHVSHSPRITIGIGIG